MSNVYLHIMRLSILTVLCLVVLVQYNIATSKVKLIKSKFFCSGAWKLIFVGVAGNGKSIYDRWHEKHHYHCCELRYGCLRRGRSHLFLDYKPKQHLRSPLIDDWRRLSIRKVQA
ncbi:hypothetical protein KUTeg_014953 [Tegillarca granosa]|uniref:Uncharacterized protein n=1 Tax=Tegillarca granosa TaxID=220873 RepID=A0ABQ9EPG1_TEGGR|nr:hypothetical protein KUTeg_014953 [Tegillarca granosa]